MSKALSELLRSRPVIFDGAMGTELYKRNQFVNVCFEELCLRRPDLVGEIHAASREAGADVITTNSFGANRFKLGDFLLADQAGQIADASARLARKAAGPELLVAGSVGPLGRHAVLVSDDEAIEAFVEAIEALMNGGADFIIFETFARRREIDLAVRAARMCGAPYVPCMAFGDIDTSIGGDSIDDFFATSLAGPSLPPLLGFNCSVGPKQMLENLEGFLPRSPAPVLAMPNAGLPQRVNDRMFYMTSPEYFGQYARLLVELGAKAVGGCCGTGPEHIAEAARTLKSLHRPRIEPAPVEVAAAAKVEPPALELRSRLGAKLAAGGFVSSVEIVPPLGWDLSKVIEKARRCAEAGVDAINVPDGPRASSRASPLVTAHLVQERAGIEAVLHVTCRDRNLIGVQSDLLGCAAAGVNNLLLVTGDPPKLGDYPNATAVFDLDSIGLTRLVDRLNRGLDVGGKPVKPATRFVTGVGVDPTNLDQAREVERFFRKAEAGALYAITQPVYDAELLAAFLEKIKAAGLPIIAGVWPLASYQNALFLKNEVPGVVIPERTLERMRKAEGKEAARREGVAIAREIAAAVRPYVRGLQVSAPFGNVEMALEVLAGP